jgi:hypothetical protein
MSLYDFGSGQLLIVSTLAGSMTTPPGVTMKPRNSTDLVEKEHLLALQKSPYCTSLSSTSST